MAFQSPKGRDFESLSVRIHWLAGPRAIAAGAGICLLGLLFLGALVRLAFALSDSGGLYLAVPLGFLSLLLALMALFCGGSGLILWLVSLFPASRPGRLWVDDALCVERGREQATFPLVAVTGAHLSPDDGVLSLRTRDGDQIQVSMGSPGTAHRLLDAIAAGTFQGTWTASLYADADEPWWITSPPLAGVVLTTLGTLATCAFTTPDVALSLGLTVGLGGMAIGALRNASSAQDCVVAGSDGLSLRQEGEDRFIAYSRVRDVEETASGVLLRLADGAAVALTLISPEVLRAGGALSVALAEKRRAHLCALLRAAIAKQPLEPPRSSALLERRGRSVRDWSAALRALVSEASCGYRAASLSRDQAAQVLEDGRAPAELRIGAALALAKGADDATFARLRVAVETCVNPAVRIALTQASYGELDEETLDIALRSAEAEAEADVVAEVEREALPERMQREP